MPSEVCDHIDYIFPNFNDGWCLGVGKNDSSPYIMDAISYSMWD